MSDISVKVDIIPEIESSKIEAAVKAAAAGTKLNIQDVEIAKAAIQAALNSATSGLKIDVSDVQLNNTANVGKNLASGIQAQIGKAQKKAKIAPALDYRAMQAATKQLANGLTPLEAKLKRLTSNGLNTAQAEKFRGSIAGITSDIKKMSSATGQEFKKIQSSVTAEMKKLSTGLATSERKLQQQLVTEGMRTAKSRYTALTSKMDKTGIGAKRSVLETAYQSTRSAVEKEAAAKLSGNSTAAASASNAAKQALESFHALSREIDREISQVQKFQSALKTLEAKHSVLGEDPNADVEKLNQLEAKLNEIRTMLGQVGTASGGDFDKLRAKLEETTASAGKMAEGIKRESKDMTSDLRSVYSLLEKIKKLESGGATANLTPAMSDRLSSIKKQTEEMITAGTASRKAMIQLHNDAKEWERDSGVSLSNGGGNGGTTSKIASIFQHVTGAMVFYSAFYKAKEAAHAMYESVVSVDDAMTQLKIVTGASGSEMNTFFKEAAASATELGHSVSDVLGSIETFSRLGYNLNDALSLSNAATVMSNVAAVSVDESTTGLTSIIKGYGLQASDASAVSDKLTAVGQDYAVSASELMEALERGGSSLASANNTLDESIALIAAGN